MARESNDSSAYLADTIRHRIVANGCVDACIQGAGWIFKRGWKPGAKPNRASIPSAIHRRIKALPCAVCGVPWFIRIDHILPVCWGGSDAEFNLQPLCHWCNAKKGHRLGNKDLAAWVLAQGLSHFLYARYRRATQHMDCYSGPGLDVWMVKNPEQVAEAKAYYKAFLARVQSVGVAQ